MDDGKVFAKENLIHQIYERKGSLIKHFFLKTQLDRDAKPTLTASIGTSKCGYIVGADINYCPICGRKLGDG